MKKYLTISLFAIALIQLIVIGFLLLKPNNSNIITQPIVNLQDKNNSSQSKSIAKINSQQNSKNNTIKISLEPNLANFFCKNYFQSKDTVWTTQIEQGSLQKQLTCSNNQKTHKVLLNSICREIFGESKFYIANAFNSEDCGLEYNDLLESKNDPNSFENTFPLDK